MSTYYEDFIRLNTERIADLKRTAESLEREVSDARVSLELERELADPARFAEPDSPYLTDWHDSGADEYPDPQDAGPPGAYLAPAPPPEAGHQRPGAGRAGRPPGTGQAAQRRGTDRAGQRPEARTANLVSHGRRTAERGRLARIAKITLAGAAGFILIVVVVAYLARTGPSWPASVPVVQTDIAQACQNPDVRSEPGQVNFACAKATRQILWVFALLTSGNNASFADHATGRLGLEPITPAQGGEVATSLNLHHPYDPASPIDSIAVAARAINDIIGGATVTSASGSTVVQPGLESSPANCRRYTGSAAVRSRPGYPGLCARPVSSPGGQAALVGDVYQKWIVGASAKDTQAAVVLFENANNPGDQQVQAILKNLPTAKPAA